MFWTADVVVIGGGVTGVSIATALALRMAGRLILIEKSFVGDGSSGEWEVGLDYPAALFASAAGEDGGPGMGRCIRSRRTGGRF